VRIFAPATIANVGPGFDCFGLALETPGDVVTLRAVDEPGVRIVAIRGEDDALPTECAQNTAGVAASAIWSERADGVPAPGLELEIDKGIPVGSGLGSSAASAAAAAWGAALLSGGEEAGPDAHEQILRAAVDGEAVASGQRHADNVAPALLGGFTIVQGIEPPRIARFQPKGRWWIGVVTPALQLCTRDARAVLPETVRLADAVSNWSNAATLVLALTRHDPGLAAAALDDRVVLPHRRRLIPGFDSVHDAAVEAGGLGCAIAGAGPSVFVLTTRREAAEDATAAMTEAFARRDLDCRTTISGISPEGARMA
jgi:homoserine kinase